MLKFYWNGIKGTDGTLQLCSYSEGPFCSYPDGSIAVYGKRYRDFSSEVRAAFTVVNNTEIQSDYCENDRIYVEPTHPLYAYVRAALEKHKAHCAKIRERSMSVCA